MLLLALLWGFSAFGQSDTLFISMSQTVHLRFASELKYVNLGSRDIVAKIVDGSKDFVAVKAREAFTAVTSMSCLEVTGEMHTFLVAYREHPERLVVDFAQKDRYDGGIKGIEEMPRGLYHIGTRGYGIEVYCEDIYVKDDVLNLLISVRNRSAVSYELSAPRFAVESKRRSRRGLQYEKAVSPKQSYGLGTVLPGAEGRLVFSFDKMALLRGQVFRVYFYEKGGSRNMVMTLGMEDVNRARRVSRES